MALVSETSSLAITYKAINALTEEDRKKAFDEMLNISGIKLHCQTFLTLEDART